METNKENQLSQWVDSRLSSLNPESGWQPNVTDGLARLSQMHHKSNWHSGRLVWVTAAIVATLLLLVALPSPKVLAHKCLECTVAVWETLAPSRVSKTTVKAENARKVAPDFDLKDEQGDEVRLLNLKGKVVLVNFWATWCEGCQVEIPLLIELEKKYASQGFVVVGISMDDDGWKSVKPWMKEKKVNYPVVIGNEAVGKQYGLQGMPLTILVDRQGKIASVHSGVLKKADTEENIRILLNGTVN